MRSPQVAVAAAVGLSALTLPARVGADAWHEEPPLPTARRLLAAAVEDGKIYTFGGCGSPCFQPPLHTSTFEERRVEVFDPKSKRWEVKRPMPAILFGAAAATAPSDEPGKEKIYLFGGFVTTSETYEYDPGEDTWARKRPMPSPRHGLAAVALGDKVYVLGGSDGRAPSAALEEYHPGNDTWRQLAPMPTARVFLAAAVLGRKIYAIGGSPDCCGNGRTDAVEVYDPATGRWSRAAPLPVALQTSAAAAARGGKLYVFGGFIPGSGVQRSTFEYDPDADRWSTKRPLPEPRDQVPAVSTPEGIHLLGGSTACHCRALAHHDRYEPDTEPEPPVDLRITKENGLAQVCPRQSVRYTIVVRNAGSQAVRGAAVKDTVPAKLTGATWTCAPASPGAACTVAGLGLGTVDLPPGGAATFTLAGAVAAGAAGRLINTAQVGAPPGTEDRELRDNEARDNDPVGPCPLPSVTKTDGRETAASGETLFYEIAVTNGGPAPLPVAVSDPLSASGLTDVRWCQGATCTPATPGDLVDAELLPAGGTVFYRAAGTVPSIPLCKCGARIENTVAVRRTDDGREATATDVTEVPRPPPGDLEVTITPAPGGEECALTRAIEVRNLGPGAACGTALRTEVAGEFALAPLSAPCAPGTPCALGDIAPGASVRLTASLTPAPGATCPAEGTLAVIAEGGCPPPGERDEASVELEMPCDLSISKTDGQAAAAPGDPLLYTIVVVNAGCVGAAGAAVGDTFPPALEGVKWCRVAGCAPTRDPPLVDTLDLAPAASETYRASGTIALAFLGTLRNTACVTPAGGGGDDSACATDCTEIVPPIPGGPPLPIPGASGPALAMLALLLAALAVARLRMAA